MCFSFFRKCSHACSIAKPSLQNEGASWSQGVCGDAFHAICTQREHLTVCKCPLLMPTCPMQVSGNMSGDYEPASPQCRALLGMAIEEDEARERREREAYYANLPNLWDPKVAAEVLEAEKPKEVISRADKTPMEFPPGSEGMLGRVYTEVGRPGTYPPPRIGSSDAGGEISPWLPSTDSGSVMRWTEVLSVHSLTSHMSMSSSCSSQHTCVSARRGCRCRRI